MPKVDELQIEIEKAHKENKELKEKIIIIEKIVKEVADRKYVSLDYYRQRFNP